MIHVRNVLRIVLVLLAVGVTVGAAVNVYGDDAALRVEAEGVACPRGCPKATSMSVDRSPFAEIISYEQPGSTIRVRCARAAILIGPYFCARY